MSSTILLEHLRDLAEQREESDRRVHRVLALGTALGVPTPDLADAARLSTSRVHAILANAGAHMRPMATSEIEYVLERANTVAVVPANTVAYSDYERYGAYICQPNRSFRDETTRLGFYADREIKPEFPKILRVWDDVILNAETAAALRASDDERDGKLADIVEDVLATRSGGRSSGRHYKVMLLSPRNHPDTLTLDQPIRHLGRGRGQAWVRRQRYTNEAALRRQPKTTTELQG